MHERPRSRRAGPAGLVLGCLCFGGSGAVAGQTAYWGSWKTDYGTKKVAAVVPTESRGGPLDVPADLDFYMATKVRSHPVVAALCCAVPDANRGSSGGSGSR